MKYRGKWERKKGNVGEVNSQKGGSRGMRGGKRKKERNIKNYCLEVELVFYIAIYFNIYFLGGGPVREIWQE